jgi:predicted  nucleic acid-binding Zn-ribbon protein
MNFNNNEWDKFINKIKTGLKPYENELKQAENESNKRLKQDEEEQDKKNKEAREAFINLNYDYTGRNKYNANDVLNFNEYTDKLTKDFYDEVDNARKNESYLSKMFRDWDGSSNETRLYKEISELHKQHGDNTGYFSGDLEMPNETKKQVEERKWRLDEEWKKHNEEIDNYKTPYNNNDTFGRIGNLIDFDMKHVKPL